MIKARDRILLDDALRDLYITPTKNNRCSYVGVELEFPIIKLDDRVKLEEVADNLLFYLKEKFAVFKFDENSKRLYDDTVTNDVISFEYSKNTLEFSMGKSLNLLDTKKRFNLYITEAQEFLNRNSCVITGMGLNPGWKHISYKPVNSEYYSVISQYLKKSIEFPYMHNYYDFCSYTCSAQTHLDIPYNNVCEAINLFSFLGMIRGSLFSNSLDVTGTIRPKYENCCRDYLYQYSMLSFHNNHIGYYNDIKSIDDLIADMKLRTIYYIKRENSYITIPQMTLEEYFSSQEVLGTSFRNKEDIIVNPEANDINCFRSYKSIEMTRLGTMEIRDDCQQPISECFVPSAFSLGILSNRKEAMDIALEMCREMKIDYLNFRNNRDWSTCSISPLANSRTYKKYLEKFIFCSYKGLVNRNSGEEKLLVPLMNRDDYLDCPATRTRRYLESGKDLKYIIKNYSKI